MARNVKQYKNPVLKSINLLVNRTPVKNIFSPISKNSPFYKDEKFYRNSLVNLDSILYLLSEIMNYGMSEINLKRYDKNKEELHASLYDTFRFLSDEGLNDEILPYVSYLRILLVLYICCCGFEEVYSVEALERVDDLIRKDAIIKTYYRGHQYETYTLVPSMYRNLKYTGIINKKKIKELYIETNLYEKYSKTIKDKPEINYEFCSYLQHSIAYSPLLDFSTSKDIATIFATIPSNNPNDYKAANAALIVLALNKESTEGIDIDNVNIQLHSRRINYRSKIFKKRLFECTLDDFKVRFGFESVTTNDRMKYQEGAFLLLEHAVIVNNILLFPDSKKSFVKLIIKSKTNAKSDEITKNELYERIVSEHPEYSYEYLLNPYEYFSPTHLIKYK